MNPYIGGIMRNDFKSENVLGFVGFAAIGVAAYAAIDNKLQIAGVAAGVGVLCFYGATKVLKECLNQKKHQEDFDVVWRENDNIHERISKLEERLDGCVEQSTFDGRIKDVYSKISEAHRDSGQDFDAVYRHISDVTSEIETRIDNCGSFQTACHSKRK